MPSISGELPKRVPSSARMTEFAGRENAAIAATRSSIVRPAAFNAFFSSAVTRYSAISSPPDSPRYSPNLGATTFSVITVPRAVIRNVDTIIKYQFPVGSTV